MAEDEKSKHAKNSNLIGNFYRMEEMKAGGLTAVEQEATFKAYGISVPADAIEAILPVLNPLRSKPLPHTAVTTAINNHDQIAKENSLGQSGDGDAFEGEEQDEEEYYEDDDEEDEEIYCDDDSE